jgi:glyoxylase-like metal-dependent hydrolase (beta-lactamase superfamily II)
MKELTLAAPHIHRLEVPFLDIYTTVFLVETEAGVVVFDTATYPEDMDSYLVPALRELGVEKPLWVVISHNHRDHAGGLERFVQLFPETGIAAGSEACAERAPGKTVRVLADGETLVGPLKAVTIPGHTADAIGILDTRTGTLLSGDCLQMYGIYGSGAWGANISLIPEHLAAGEKLLQMDIQTILASHNYHPYDWRADGKEAVAAYIAQCANALRDIRAYGLAHKEQDVVEIAEAYNASSNLPRVASRIFKAAMEHNF